MSKWFVIYGLIIPVGFIFETASGLLQIAGKFKYMAGVNLAQNLVTTLFVGLAFFSSDPLMFIVIGYLVGKSVSGFGYAIAALLEARKLFGAAWWKVGFDRLPPQKDFWGFAFSSNFSATINLLVRDSDILWVNFFLSPLQGGYYKLAVSLIGFMLIPIDPFIKTSYPEITKYVAEGAWGKLRSLLKRLTTVSGTVTLAFGVGLFIFGRPLIGLVYGEVFMPAWEPTMLLFLGYGFANTFFWNRPLMLALGEPYFPLKITALVGAIKLILSYYLIQTFGIIIQACLMSVYFIVSIGAILWKGSRKIQQAQGKILEQG